MAQNMVVPVPHFFLPSVFLRWGKEKIKSQKNGGRVRVRIEQKFKRMAGQVVTAKDDRRAFHT